MKVALLKSLDFIKEPEDLISFYKSLGWDGNSNLDVKKIVLNESDVKTLHENFVQLGKDKEEKTQRNLLWLGYGPSFSKDIPKGKIHLYK